MIAKSVNLNKVKSYIHVSALNVDIIKDSKYALSKYNGEIELKKEFSNAVIVRPSVVFGKEITLQIFFLRCQNSVPFFL